ncbi:MAG: hypothetical protein RLZZ324_56, partial [Candidatus Parcubacteria bacterium]
MDVRNPHALPIDDLLAALDTDAKAGLSDAAAAGRLNADGPNALPEPPRTSSLYLFFKQFNSALIYILIAAGIISIAAGEAQDAFGIALALLLKAVIGYVQERRAEDSVRHLRSLSAPEATVMRDGMMHRIPAAGIAVGDIVLLAEGARVPADARIIDSRDLRTDESALTGESRPVEKHAGVAAVDAALPDRTGMLWAGTVVVSGVARAAVTEIGTRTAFGKIALSLQAITRGRTPLESRLDALGRNIGAAALLLAVVAFGVGVWRGFPLREMFFFTVAMLVSVVPEGLPAVLAVVLGIGVQRMAKRGVIVRHVPSVETLGAADVICTDKTGTLTENKMTVRRLALAGHDVAVSGEGWEPKGTFTVDGREMRAGDVPELEALLVAAAFSSSAVIDLRQERYEAIGDATEGALTVLAAKAGIGKDALAGQYRVLDELPFSSGRKYRATLTERTDADGVVTRTLYVSGAFG